MHLHIKLNPIIQQGHNAPKDTKAADNKQTLAINSSQNITETETKLSQAKNFLQQRTQPLLSTRSRTQQNTPLLAQVLIPRGWLNHPQGAQIISHTVGGMEDEHIQLCTLVLQDP